jgi:nitroreductase
MDLTRPAATHRKPDFPVDPIFPGRWSPRSMTGGHVDKPTLMILLEAARWAPSSFNGQPWRFLYALRGTPYFASYLDLLTENNRAWASQAGALVIIASRDTFEANGKRALTHSFDAGAAWMAFALQGRMLGLAVRGMQGFDYDKARELAGLPDGFSVEAMAAVGYPAPPDALPDPLKEKERPNTRKPVSEFAFEGKFPD